MNNAFDNTYPYTDFHELNLDWVLSKIKAMKERVDNLDETILTKCKEYTDEQLANYQAQVDALRVELTAMVVGVENDFDNLKIQINQSLHQMDIKIDNLRDDMIANINAVNQRTDLAIEQNNVYILSQIAHFLSGIEVLNALTGTTMTIQEMLNYLCTLHMTGAITYTNLTNANNTYNEITGYYMSYTQLAMNGANIIQVNT